MARSYISTRRFLEEPYSAILGYPRATGRQLGSRMRELEKLGIGSISLTGPVTLGRTAVLGKGYAGVVVLARRGGRTVALKIRRTDSQRDGMRQEARMLGAANSAGVGPRLHAASRNFLVMEYLKGERIGDWVAGLGGAGSAARLRRAVRDVLEDCYRLDRLGLDHGELSNISKHAIMGSRSTVIDFESASMRRRPSNVTSAAQAIFIGSGIAKRVQRIYRNPPREATIGALRAYKLRMTRESFEDLLGVLRL